MCARLEFQELGFLYWASDLVYVLLYGFGLDKKMEIVLSLWVNWGTRSVISSILWVRGMLF